MNTATQTISLLRQRIIEDMRMRKLSPKTQSGYLRTVIRFCGWLGRSPDTATAEDLRRYQLYLVEHGVSAISLNITITGLKFFFDSTLDQPELMRHMHPVRVLSRLFRRRFVEALEAAQRAGQLQFFGEYAPLAEATAFAEWLVPLRKCEWVVYAKRPFAGPAAVLAYLLRYTHRVAIANSRLLALDERGVTFKWKDYRETGTTRHKTMTLSADEFMRCFLLHVLPRGFHRIRHYGLIANSGRRENLARARELLHVAPTVIDAADTLNESAQPTFVCRECCTAMVVTEILARAPHIRAPPQLRSVS